MGDMVKRVLFVNSEIFPYIPESAISKVGRTLPQGIQEKRKEIRAFMPRYGCVNERKFSLHEVIRLSGMNIIISDTDRPLSIKVASISAARLQVYFIDNDDYFHRKQLYRDEKGRFFPDNGERAIFFARGVLETVKKQRWAPDVVHCHGWISQVLPLYLKKAYKDDPIFSSSKVVLSLYDDTPKETFEAGFADALSFGSITREDTGLEGPVDGTLLAKLAVRYADGIIMGAPEIDKDVAALAEGSGLPILPYDGASMEDGSYIDRYNSFYESIL